MNSAVWFITWQCPNKCPYCWQEDDTNSKRHQLQLFKSPSEYAAAWNKLNMSIIDISGGEPSIYPGLYELISKLNCRVAITSNFKNSVMQIAELSPTKLISITASLHPTQTQPTETSFFGKCVFLRNRGFNITVNFVAYPEQLWLIPKYAQLCKDSNLHFHVDLWGQKTNNNFVYTDIEMNFLKQVVGKNRPIDPPKQKGLCSGGTNHINVQPNGDAYRCILEAEQQQHKLGNIFDKDFKLSDTLDWCVQRHICPGCDRDKVIFTSNE